MKKILIIVSVLLLVSCRSLPSSFFMLAEKSADKEIAVKRKTNLGIFVKIPKYIERPQIITKKNEVEMQMSEYNRWLSPLEDNITDVLAMDIASHSKKISVESVGANRKNIDYIVLVEIKQFGGILGDKVFLSALWKIKDGNDEKVLVSSTSDYEEKIGSEYSEMVMGLSNLIGRLSDDITLRISKI